MLSQYLQVQLATQANFEPKDSPPVPLSWHPALLPAPPDILRAFPPFSSTTRVHIYATEKGVHRRSSSPDHDCFCADTGHPPPWAAAVVVILLLCRAGQRELERTLGTWGFRLCANTYQLVYSWRKEWVRNYAYGVLLENGCLHVDTLFCHRP